MVKHRLKVLWPKYFETIGQYLRTDTSGAEMQHRTHNVFGWFLLLGLGVLCPVSSPFMAPVQAGPFNVKPAQERKMGDEAAREIEAQVRIVSGPVADWVNRVGRRLAAVSDSEFEYSFKVIDRPEINAFALPGGHIYVFTGLRKVVQTDDELAAVLAHEITHSEQHHYARQYSRASKRGAILGIVSAVVGLPNLAAQALSIADLSLTQRYSRGLELESDTQGMQRMVRAGFNPRGMVSLLEKMAKEESRQNQLDRWFAGHPDGPKRVRSAQQQVQEIQKLQAQNKEQVKPLFAPWPSSIVGSAENGS
jgi:predicted Zn-dependent protease